MVRGRPPARDELLGRRVQIRADATDRAGDTHEAAGRFGIVTSRPTGGRYSVAAEGVGSVMLTLDAFDVLPEGDAIAAPAGDREGGQDMLIALIVPGRYQPRRHFDEQALQDLAETIKLYGVMQPILVRRLPADRLQDTWENRGDRRRGDPLPTHEIIAGERRWRASQIAGLTHIPVLVREPGDEAVAVMQLVENMQREDLDPLEEAEGFERLMHEFGYSAEDVGTKVRKGRSHVYETIKLLSLTGEPRAALREGRLSRSTALLIARVPTEALQLAAFRDILPEGGEQITVLAAKELIRRKYMLDLAAAPFDRADAALCPKAGACTTCSKRTGASPELFADVKSADVCTDTRCHGEKKAAHFERIRLEAVSSGRKVIQGAEARQILPQEGGMPAGHILLDKPAQIAGATTDQPLRTLLGSDLPADKVVLIETPSGAMVEAMPIRDASEAIAAQRAPAAKKPTAAERKAQLQAEYEDAWRRAAIATVLADVQGSPTNDALPPVVWARLIRQEAAAVDRELAAQALGMPPRWNDGDLDRAIERAAETPGSAVLMLAAIDELRADPQRPAEHAPQLDAIASYCGIDLAAIKASVRDAMRTDAAARALAEADKPAAAKPARKAPKPKTTKEEASAAIAQAMQEADQAQEGAEP